MNRILIAASMLFMIAGQAKDASAQIKLASDNIEEVVDAMTLKEKASLLVGGGYGSMLGAGILSPEKIMVPGAAGVTRSVARLGIPSIVLSDGPAGVRISPTRKGSAKTYYCTGFPVGTLLSCTWNEDLVEEVGTAMGSEALEYGVDILLAPGMNLMRNPLCGRNFEYYSEDPLLSGKTAAAFIRGVQSCGVGTSAKHFAANNQETNRFGNNSIVDEKTLRKLYLKGFEIAVRESRPWTVMSSYNKLNGVYTQESEWLLTQVLRDEWGFDGIVMTDWTGRRNTAAQINAGNNLLAPGLHSQIKDIVRKVRKGEISEEVLDDRVRGMLELIVKTPRFKGHVPSDSPDLASHAAVSRRAATEGMVLLENNGVLPLAGISSIALFGVGSYDLIAGGTGSGNVNKPYVVGLEEGLESAGYRADAKLAGKYRSYLSNKKNRKKGYVMVGEAAWEEMQVANEDIKAAAAGNDAAILTISRQAGEGQDRGLEGDFNLSDGEKKLIEEVCTEFHRLGKKVVVVLNIGGVIETASWKNLPDAVLLAWAPGQEGGNAIVDILSGKVNPSGKLSITFPLAYGDIPSSANFPSNHKFGFKDSMATISGHGSSRGNTKDVDYTVYEEGENVGYRYFGTSGEGVSYPFGYGLSYTSFSIENVGSRYVVTNTGSTPGKEVLIVYNADEELSFFAKTRLLAPGESEEVVIP